MKTQCLISDENRLGNFKTFIQSLVEKFKPLRIICFGKQTTLNCINGCFGDKHLEENHYCLLIVTQTNVRIDYEVQDYANTYAHNAQITIICHGVEAINGAIQANNRFFITVLSAGQTLYSSDGIIDLDTIPEFIPTDALQKAEKHFYHRIPLAEAFLEGAYGCMLKEHFNICTFMLHQVVEQCCIVLIRVQLDYRSEFHNLHRLLNLCRCFSDEPYNLFLSGNISDKRLFDLLTKSYSQARYASSFHVEKDNATQLYNKASEFLQLIKRKSKNKMEELEQNALRYIDRKGREGEND